ncbi:proteinaceous RNase P 2 [Citrus sinensis]|nr:proteinaceous RNase P 2 [Citrus sinensis]
MSNTTSANPSKPNKKRKTNPNPETNFLISLQSCTKSKDLATAISLYESALSLNFRLSLHHFNALLYLCSNSATDPSLKDSALRHGFRVFDQMLSNNVIPNEALVTSVARLAASKKDSDYAFELIKRMNNEFNVVPRLRTYDPALFCFCENLEAQKAYEVEEHMGLMGGQKVNGVSCDLGLVKNAVLKNGGGWHGLGWIGQGKWVVKRGSVDESGKCCSCGNQLACVDIDDAETERFAQSVAALAMEQEVKANFSESQDWLEKNANYEAIVDGSKYWALPTEFRRGRIQRPSGSLYFCEGQSETSDATPILFGNPVLNKELAITVTALASLLVDVRFD